MNLASRNYMTMHLLIGKVTSAFLLALLAIGSIAQDKNTVPIAETITSNTFRPRRVDATADRIKLLHVPEGFSVNIFASGTGNPRMMKVMRDGRVYVTDCNNGKLLLIKDTDNDKKADVVRTILEMEHLHGITSYQGKLYLATIKEIYTAEINPDGTLGLMKPIITDLPDAGQHHNRTIKFDKDSTLYISIGSTCNSCEETNKESATMLEARSDGSARRVYARGLRNTIGFDWHPVTHEMWGWDNGTDHLGDNEGREELNKLTDKADYGWPFIYEKGKYVMHHDPKGMPHKAYAAKCTASILEYDAHGASMEYIFYTGDQFPKAYLNNGFVAMRGSWNRQQPVGYRVLLVRYDAQGKPVKTEDFFWGFLTDNNTSMFGRPVGLAQYIDGSLLVSDDVNGIIYRISAQPAK